MKPVSEILARAVELCKDAKDSREVERILRKDPDCFELIAIPIESILKKLSLGDILRTINQMEQNSEQRKVQE